MSIELNASSIIQIASATIISSGIIAIISMIISNRKKHDRQNILIAIKLESIYYGMTNINDQFATIGKDFKKGYDNRKKELMDEHDFKDNE